MELLLELRHTAGGSTRHADVRVTLEPDDTVAVLTEALSSHALQRGFRPRSSGVGLARAGSDDPLDPAHPVVDTGIVSGETVVLVETVTPPRSDVRTGPRPGAAQPLSPPPPPPPPVPGSSRSTEGGSAAFPPPPPPPVPVPAFGIGPDLDFDSAGSDPGAGRSTLPGPVTAELVLRREQASPSDLRASGGLTLDVTAGPGVGRVIPLRRDITVGRSDQCTVTIDDPTMSREHFALQVTDDRRVLVIPNPQATNGTRVAGIDLTEATEVELGQLIEAGSSIFALRTGVAEETRRRDRLGQVPFNRVPYRRTVVWPAKLAEVPAPPATPSVGKLSIVTALMPLVGAGAMAMLMQRYIFLLLAVMSPVMLVWRHFSNKRGGKRKYRREKAAYYENLAAAVVTLDASLEDERQTRLAAAPDLAELARQAMLHMPRLWERDRQAGDLLDLRLGLGNVESKVTLEIKSGGEEALRAEGHAQLAHQATVHDVPITVDLLDIGTAGLWGDRAQVASSGRALLAQSACLHSPEDLVIAAALGPDSLDGFEWLKWLPHVRSATSPLEGPHLAVGAEATNNLLISLLAVAADRSERAKPGAGAGVWPRVLLILEEHAEPDRALLSQLLDVAPGFGIHAIWLGESELQVPRQCRAVVSCPGTGRPGRVRFTDPSRADRMVELDGAEPATARSISRSLAPLRDASAGSQTTAIPRVVPLFDVVGVGADGPTAQDVANRWRTPRPYGLSFPIGVSADGVLGLDLVEHGPHTLIGGTSGSGKSELLQSLVLSLAANHSPRQLNFLFVDYKGGASSAEFRDLPHTVGYVTNLSGRMAMRALTSLRAELQRRMKLMEGKAKDLREMIDVAPAEAPPSLVIVVDEFATLVKEIPDFMAGVVDIAQRGRSLGVHLILATQRPTGVVNDNILANTNLRISLRMLDPVDSNNIIGSKDAAEIPVPLRGRGYARMGPKALVPFQCAWSGAPAVTEHEVHAAGVSPFSFLTDAASVTSAEPNPGGRDTGRTQLEVLVAACADAARALGMPPVRRPWLEPLPEVLPLGAVLQQAFDQQLTTDPGRVALLGTSDDPQNQAQHIAAVDLEETGGLVVFGTGGSGKTTLLRSLAVGLACQGGADAVQLYALDFASRSLDQLGDLPQCGAVIAGDEVERTCRLLTLLDQEVVHRRTVLAEHRAENLGALRRQTGEPCFPRIVVLLDGYAAFHSTFDRSDRFRWVTRLQQLVSAGRQVGVHLVMTADRRMGIPPALLSAIGARVALRMSTPEELSALGVPSKVAKDAELPNGRGFLNGATEVQVACVSIDPSALAQSEAITQVVERLRATATLEVPQLPELPSAVPATSLPATTEVEPLTAPFGVVDLTMQTAVADLRRQNMVVLGPPVSGKSTALATIAAGLRASSGGAVQLGLLAGPSSPLRDVDVWDDAAFTTTDQAELVDRLTGTFVGDDGREVKVVLFVDAAEDVEGVDVTKPLEALGRNGGLRLVVAAETGTVSKAYMGWLSPLRRNRSALLLQPESRSHAEATLGIKPELRPDQEFPAGRGLFVANRRWSLLQVAQTTPQRNGGTNPLRAVG